MFIPLPAGLFRNQDFDACLREACHQLYLQGINNYLHYTEPQRLIELTDTHQWLIADIDFIHSGISLNWTTHHEN